MLLDGQTALVTGTGRGIGPAIVTALRSEGARVLCHARTEIDARRASIDLGGEPVWGDLSTTEGVREVGAQARHLAPQLHVLVHNAGVLPPERRETAEGLELTFATNVLGPHLLTRLLRERLVESAPARVLFVSSGGMYTRRLEVDDLQSRTGSFDGRVAYARSKRADVVLAERWAEEFAGTGVVVHAMHPGWADTPGIKSSIPTFQRIMRPLLRTPAQGADTIVWLAAAEEPGRITGRFWCDRHVRATHRLARTQETAADRDRLWHALDALAAGASARI
jgi:dehydrogenase/reductase SDR family protein 12